MDFNKESSDYHFFLRRVRDLYSLTMVPEYCITVGHTVGDVDSEFAVMDVYTTVRPPGRTGTGVDRDLWVTTQDRRGGGRVPPEASGVVPSGTHSHDPGSWSSGCLVVCLRHPTPLCLDDTTERFRLLTVSFAIRWSVS